MLGSEQGLVKRTHKRVDVIHHAEQYHLKAARLEAKLKKAKGDLENKQSQQNIEKIVHDGLMKGNVFQPCDIPCDEETKS